MANEVDIQGKGPVDPQGRTVSGVDAIAKLADVSNKSGLRNTALGAGIIIMLSSVSAMLVTVTDISANAVVAGLLVGGALVVTVLITSSLEYRVQLQSELQKIEMDTKRYEVDMHFRIAQIHATEPAHPESDSLTDRPK